MFSETGLLLVFDRFYLCKSKNWFLSANFLRHFRNVETTRRKNKLILKPTQKTFCAILMLIQNAMFTLISQYTYINFILQSISVH